MTDLYVALVFVAVLAIGLTTPFVFALGYVWVDAFYPQLVAPTLLGGMPVSLIMAVGAVGSYVVFDRRAMPRMATITWLTLLMALWVTLTTTWAVAPLAAWAKWNWAVKTILFSTFIPVVFRSRVQIEAMLLVYVFSAMAHILPVGLKSMISGGHYGVDLGLLGNNEALSESSGLATVSIMFIPLYLFFRKHSVVLPAWRIRGPGFAGLIALDIATAIGTVARTAVIGFAVVAVTLWLRSKRKFAVGVLILLIAAGGGLLVSASWDARISTIASYDQENSAYTRILVWRWTLDFVRGRPLGGGFEAFRIDRVEEPMPDGSVRVEYGRAFHSTYFELLGEHGWPGLVLFLTILATAFWNFHRVIVECRGIAGLQWCADLAGALQCALAVLASCGAFIGIGFQPMFWYIFALSTCLRAYVYRVKQPGIALLARSRPGRRLPVSAKARLVPSQQGPL